MKRRADSLLWIGVAAGLGLALLSVARSSRVGQASVPAGAVAVVNGEPILETDYRLTLRSIVEAAGRQAPTEQDRKSALDRLVDDELLIAYGLTLGMPRSDQATRHALLASVLRTERATVEAEEPSPSQLLAYYARIRGELVPPGEPIPTLEEARDALLARYRAERADAAFTRKVDALRKAARVQVVERLP